MIKKVYADGIYLSHSMSICHRIIIEKDNGKTQYIAFTDFSTDETVAQALRGLADWVEGESE